MTNIFWGDTDNVYLKIKKEISLEQLETLHELHPKAYYSYDNSIWYTFEELKEECRE